MPTPKRSAQIDDLGSLRQFGADVNETARMMLARGAAGCWGERKVFICRVAAEMGVRDLETFKDFLRAAARNGYVYLSRADLPETMPRKLVAESMTWHDDVSMRRGDSHCAWHFVVVDDARPMRAPQEVAAFAKLAQKAADNAPTGVWHGNKVFISHVFLEAKRMGWRGTLTQFKKELVEANGHALLELSRADLVQAMPRQDVAESETLHVNGRFHFVRVSDAVAKRRGAI